MISLKEFQEKYDLNLDEILVKIKKSKAKKVLIQFPDGLKPYATEIVNFIEKNIPKVQIKIWFGTCYGACDIPQTDADLILQFGHATLNI